MKATIARLADRYKITFENGTVIYSGDKDSKDWFIAKVSKEFEDEYLEDLKVEEEQEDTVYAPSRLHEADEAGDTIHAIDDEVNLGGRPEGRRGLEEVMAEAEAAKVHKGKKISFLAYGSDEILEGRIRFVWVDKREPMAMYRIRLKNGKSRNKVVTSQEITIFD